ncbi:MAG TPA: metallopeptidase TldD-related protein [Candidatus Binataceae bacterium]|nr:metallopeptidase TldD-related protein [Candidatus Binataceae bacterium]
MMLKLTDLKAFVREAESVVARDREVASFEIYASSSDNVVARLNYTSDIPCRGVEELKSHSASGFQIRVQGCADAHSIGVAHETGALSLEVVRAALARAHSSTISDPEFPGFPTEPRIFRVSPSESSDLMRGGERAVAAAAWRIIRGGADVFARSRAAKVDGPGFILGGDITLIRDRIALASSNFSDIRLDQSAHFSSSIAVLIESRDGKGTASASGSTLRAMNEVADRLGCDATRRALALTHGARPDSGSYRVVLGPQPVAEILNYMIMGSLTTGSFHAASSAYQGRFGDLVMDARLNLTDEPMLRGGAIARRITCEGLPTKRVKLIRDGRLVGLLSNFYDTHRLAHDKHRDEKLGPKADGAEFSPSSGYRLGEGGGRRFDQSPGSAGTNVVMRSRAGVSEAELIRRVRDGLYIGRVWYTYPINGQRAGDFTCTVSGDSYVIRNGRLAEPIAANALRINSNVNSLREILVAENRARHATVWGSAEAYRVPAIAIEALQFSSVQHPRSQPIASVFSP